MAWDNVNNLVVLRTEMLLKPPMHGWSQIMKMYSKKGKTRMLI